MRVTECRTSEGRQRWLMQVLTLQVCEQVATRRGDRGFAKWKHGMGLYSLSTADTRQEH